MITWFLSLLRNLGFKDTIIGILFTALAFTAAQWHKASKDAENIKSVYSHPEVKVVEKTVVREGPVRIVTKIREVPGGAKETTIEEEHQPETTYTLRSNESHPVPIASTMAQPRTDRYLVSVGMNRLTPDFDGKALFVGYGFKNRLDVQVGGVEHNGFSPWVLATVRF